MSRDDREQAKLCGEFGTTLSRAAAEFLADHPGIEVPAVLSALVTLTVATARNTADKDWLLRMVHVTWDAEGSSA